MIHARMYFSIIFLDHMSFSLFHDDGVLQARIHGQTLKAIQTNVSFDCPSPSMPYARFDKSEYDPIFSSIPKMF